MNTLATIKEILNKMIEVHERLYQLAKEKQDILIRGDVNALQTNISHESTCVEKIQHLEQERVKELQFYFSSKGIESYSVTIKDLIETLRDSGEKIALESRAKKLLLLVTQINEQNERNQLLLQTSLSYIQYSLSLLIKKEHSVGYGPRSFVGKPRILDARV